MKRKEFFNLGLYLEGLRRVRLPGIIFFVIMTLEAVLLPLIYVIDEISTKTYLLEIGETYVPSPMSVSVLEAHPFLIASFIIIAPVMAWTLFSFLNKRNASDFYHSLPHTRLAVYVSTAAALVTWIAGLILIPSGISRLFLSLFPDIFSVVPGSYGTMMLGCFAASMLIAAVIVVAMCISGTVFSNIIVAGLIMFFPRYVIMFITNGVSSAFPLVPIGYVSRLLSVDINIVSGLTMGWLLEGESIDCLVNLSSQIYTLVISVVYFIVGAVLFYRRKSESADRAAPSPFMQAVYRITVAMVICVPICYFIFTDTFSSEDWFGIFILYLIAILAYFIYELITTRKWKNLIKALPGLGIVAILNAALFLAMSGITAVEKNFSPDAEDIEYVQLVEESPNTWEYMSFFEYAQNEASGVKITDKEALKTVAEALKSTLEYFDEEGTIDNQYRSDKYGNYTPSHELFTFKIKAGYTTKYRTVRINSSDSEAITSALAEAEGYADSWLLLPEPQRGTISVDIGNTTLDNEQAEKLFEIMQNEVSALDFKEWYNFLSEDSYEQLCLVTYTTNGTTIYIPISAELMPKTTKAYFEFMLEFPGKNAEDILEMISKDNGNNIELNYIELYQCGETGEYTKRYFSGELYENGNIVQLLDECIDTEKPEIGESFIVLDLLEIIEKQFDTDGFVYYESIESHFAILKLKEGAMEKLTEYITE